MLLIVSGPSGVGKSRLIELAVAEVGFKRIVPFTTRAPRAEEREGHDDVFVSREEFQNGVRQGRFFDWDYTIANYYGYGPEIAQVSPDDNVVIPVLARMA